MPGVATISSPSRVIRTFPDWMKKTSSI
jgi:hypothetical protein